MLAFNNYKNTLFFTFAAIFVGLAVIGGIRGYSAVPYWDMWNGYLGFFTKISNGDWSVWWAQHNEHRIVLARILFWLDLQLFKGQGWFLLVVNYILLLIVCVLFFRIWNQIESSSEYSWIRYFLIAWLFWWIQKENLEWGFQSQFFLAQLLPLLSFYFLYCACAAGQKKSGYFILSLLSGVLAIGSMANGILTLPLMVIFASLAKMGWRRILLIAVFAIASVALYFYEYTFPGHHGSLRQAVSENPIGLMHYLAVYMGGPFSFGSKSIGLWTSTLAGSFLVISCIFIAARLIYSHKMDPLQLMLLVFILYMGGTALGTGGGRLIFGVEQALSSRYMTPSLMAWAAFFLLLHINLNHLRTYSNAKLWKFLLLLLILMLPQQLTALKSQNTKLYERDVAGLALELGVSDQAQIGHVFPSAISALDIVQTPVQKNWSIFGSHPLIDLREKVGIAFDSSNYLSRECIGHLDTVKQIETDERFLKVTGWIFYQDSVNTEGLVTFVGPNNQIQGYGLTGHERPDVADAINEKARHAGFKGYIRASSQGDELFILSNSAGCRLSVSIPVFLFKVVESSNLSIRPTVKVSSLDGTNDWIGADYYKSSFPNLRVLGSYIHSDADIGSVFLKMKRGDRLYYRSGPTDGRQTVEIIGHDGKPTGKRTILPKAVSWQLLEFSSESLPELFTAKFSDEGDGWGEWSAIGINSDEVEQ